MTPEKIALFEKCYRNWNGTSVMESAAAELLAEIKSMQSELVKEHSVGHRLMGQFCPVCQQSPKS